MVSEEWYFELPPKRWYFVPSLLPVDTFAPRTGHAAAVFKKRFVYVFGGIDNEGARTNDLHIFDLRERTWRLCTAANGQPPSPRSGVKVVALPSLNSSAVNSTSVEETTLLFFGGYITKDL
jgi:hypothetical protein